MYYLRMLQLRRMGRVMLAPDTGAGGGEGGQAGAQGNDGGDGEGEGQSGADGQNGEKTFTQADIDKILKQEQAKWKRQQEKAVSEAQRLANMTAEQRAQEEAKQRVADLERREADLNRRELRAQALETLATENLPADLADLLDYTDADKCSASIAKVKKNWQAAVQKGVEARVAGSPPKTGSGKSGVPKTMRDAISAYYKK